MVGVCFLVGFGLVVFVLFSSFILENQIVLNCSLGHIRHRTSDSCS